MTKKNIDSGLVEITEATRTGEGSMHVNVNEGKLKRLVEVSSINQSIISFFVYMNIPKK